MKHPGSALTMIAAATMAVASIVGCGGPAKPPAPETEIAAYTVRGRIVQLPDPGNPAAELIIRHEPIPSFMSGGEVVGMGAMTMPFPSIKPDVSLDGFAVGDAISLTFEVEYDPVTRTPAGVVVTAADALPDDVELAIDPPAAG